MGSLSGRIQLDQVINCETNSSCTRNAAYRVEIKHSAGSQTVFWHYCEDHCRQAKRKYGGRKHFEIVNVYPLA